MTDIGDFHGVEGAIMDVEAKEEALDAEVNGEEKSKIADTEGLASTRRASDGVKELLKSTCNVEKE